MRKVKIRRDKTGKEYNFHCWGYDYKSAITSEESIVQISVAILEDANGCILLEEPQDIQFIDKRTKKIENVQVFSALPDILQNDDGSWYNVKL